jgi:hypothetical protein
MQSFNSFVRAKKKDKLTVNKGQVVIYSHVGSGGDGGAVSKRMVRVHCKKD